MSIDRILEEASTVLSAAKKYESELLEAGMTADDFQHMRTLIAQVAAHHYSLMENRTSVAPELYELQAIKETLLKTATLKFGAHSPVLKEFCHERREDLCRP